MTMVYYTKEDIMRNTKDKKSPYNWKCKCGHKLYMHGFTRGGLGDSAYFWVSQCTSCKCSEYHKKEKKKK